MQKKIKALIIVSSALIVLSLFAFDLFNFSSKRIRVRKEELVSKEIGKQLDDVKIAFFSDLRFGTFVDAKRLANIVDKLNQNDVDAVIFGGDIFDEGVTPTQEMIDEITSAYQKIEAPLGKFAVYGDTDHQSEACVNAVQTIYANSDFEILNNTSISLHNVASDSIALVGLDSALAGTPDTNAAFANVSHNAYVITVCHTPDEALDIPEDLCDYFLAGHSLGGQIYYGLGAYYTPEKAVHYFRDKHTISNTFTLDITNGVGTTGRDMRFWAPGEIVVYTLQTK